MTSPPLRFLWKDPRMAFNRFLFTFRFISKEPYIDKTRMGVYGRVREPLPWLQQCSPSTVDDVTASLHPSPQAYGGYLATMLLSSGEFTQLKCGAVVSPITDFEIYGIVFIHFPSCRALQPLTLVLLSCSFGIFRAIFGLKDRLEGVHGESASLP